MSDTSQQDGLPFEAQQQMSHDAALDVFRVSFGQELDALLGLLHVEGEALRVARQQIVLAANALRFAHLSSHTEHLGNLVMAMGSVLTPLAVERTVELETEDSEPSELANEPTAPNMYAARTKPLRTQTVVTPVTAPIVQDRPDIDHINTSLQESPGAPVEDITTEASEDTAEGASKTAPSEAVDDASGTVELGNAESSDSTSTEESSTDELQQSTPEKISLDQQELLHARLRSFIARCYPDVEFPNTMTFGQQLMYMHTLINILELTTTDAIIKASVEESRKLTSMHVLEGLSYTDLAIQLDRSTLEIRQAIVGLAKHINKGLTSEQKRELLETILANHSSHTPTGSPTPPEVPVLSDALNHTAQQPTQENEGGTAVVQHHSGIEIRDLPSPEHIHAADAIASLVLPQPSPESASDKTPLEKLATLLGYSDEQSYQALRRLFNVDNNNPDRSPKVLEVATDLKDILLLTAGDKRYKGYDGSLEFIVLSRIAYGSSDKLPLAVNSVRRQKDIVALLTDAKRKFDEVLETAMSQLVQKRQEIMRPQRQ